MMYFFTPGTGILFALLGIGLVVGLIAYGLKTASEKMLSTDGAETPSFGEIQKQMGPMNWTERVVSAVLIIAFVTFVVWLAS